MTGQKLQLSHKVKRVFRLLGPGLITGAADDDPSGIATHSQTGAQFGFGQLWTTFYLLPFMIAVQEACARIGAVTGKGIIAVVKENYSKKIVLAVVTLVLIANIFNIGTDIGAMAAAAQLILPVHFAVLTVAFTFIILALEIFTSYRTYVRILKWLTVALLSYVVTALIVKVPLITIFKATFIPHMEFSFPFLFIITGVIGTTISPYMFFWEAAEEVEEERKKHLLSLHDKPKINWKFIRQLRIDNALGMIISNAIAWCIVVTTATVLHGEGITNINTSADAARALEPLVSTFPNSGYVAKLLFSTGVIGLGLLAVPILSGSASYAVSEAFNWKASLNYKLKRAPGFYAVITLATLIGLLINFIGIDPIKALVVTAVINGIVSVPLIFLIGSIASNPKIMGEFKSNSLANVLIFSTFLLTSVAALAMLAAYFNQLWK